MPTAINAFFNYKKIKTFEKILHFLTKQNYL